VINTNLYHILHRFRDIAFETSVGYSVGHGLNMTLYAP